MTLITCKNKECIYAKKRKDGSYQCSCDTIMIDKDTECDTYTILPEIKKNICKKCGKPIGNPIFCVFCEEELRRTY